MKRWLIGLLSVFVPVAVLGMGYGVVHAQQLIVNGGFDPGIALAFWDVTGTTYWELVSGDGMARVPSGSSISQQFTSPITGSYQLQFWCDNVFAQGVSFRVVLTAGENHTYDEVVGCTNVIHAREVMLVPNTPYTLTFSFHDGAPVGGRLDDIALELVEAAPDFDSGYVSNGAFYGPEPWFFFDLSGYEMEGTIGYGGNPGYARIAPLGSYVSQTLTVPSDGIYELRFHCKSSSTTLTTEIQYVLYPDDFRTSNIFAGADCTPDVWAVTVDYYLLFAGYEYTLWLQNQNLVASAYLDNISLLETGIPFHHVNTGAVLNGEWYGYDEWGFSDGGSKFDNRTGVTTDTVGSLILHETIQEDLVAQSFVIDDPAPTVERVLSFDCSSLYSDSLLDIRLELGLVSVFHEQVECATDEEWTNYAYTLTLLTAEEYEIEISLYEDELGFTEYIWVDNIALPLSEIEPTPTPTPSPSPTATNTPTPTNTPPPTPTNTPGPSPTPSITPTPDPSATPPPTTGDDPTCIFEPNNPACLPVPTGPAGGTCYQCTAPRRLSASAVSYWIAWLACVIRNLFSCSLRVWLYDITNNTTALVRVFIGFINWGNGNLQDGVNWAGMIANGFVGFIHDMYVNLANFLAATPQQLTIVLNTVVGTASSGLDWLSIIWLILQILFSLFIQFLTMMYMGILNMLGMVINAVRGLQIAVTAPAFELDLVLGDTEPITPNGEPGTGQAMQLLIWGLIISDSAITDYGLWPFLYVLAGLFGIITIIWVFRQWHDILPM